MSSFGKRIHCFKCQRPAQAANRVIGTRGRTRDESSSKAQTLLQSNMGFWLWPGVRGRLLDRKTELSPLGCQFPPSLSPCFFPQVRVTHSVALFFILSDSYIPREQCLPVGWIGLHNTFISSG